MTTGGKISRLNLVLILLILLSFGGLTYLSLRPTPQAPAFENLPQNPQTPTVPLIVSGHQLLVEIRRTSPEKALGLSGRESLPQNTGMLFVFDPPEKTGFWMKDMLFDLDIVWIKAGRIIQIDTGVKAPQNQRQTPQSVFPPEPIDYVLELNSGAALELGLKVGDPVELPSLTPDTPQ